MTNAPEYLRARDIARLTGVSLRTARRWIANKILASVKVGGARLVARGELERLLSPPHKVDDDHVNDAKDEVPDELARRLRWYRRHILPRLGADVNGSLFVTRNGSRKSQATITGQITDALARHIGIHMTPHQFRHFGATSYLERHPEDFETARALLGHAWTKTTRIYAGSSSRRASRAYNQHLMAQREALKLMRPTRLSRKSRP